MGHIVYVIYTLLVCIYTLLVCICGSFFEGGHRTLESNLEWVHSTRSPRATLYSDLSSIDGTQLSAIFWQVGRFDLAILLVVAGERGGMVFMSDFKKWNMYILWLIRQDET